jgi:hypothetical protein
LRKWLAPLSRDPELLADFKAHLDELHNRVLAGFLKPDADVPYLRGMAAGIADVRGSVTMYVNEEASRARRPTAA